MNIRKQLLACATVFIFSTVYASGGGPYVDNFTYHNEPIHPRCIAQLLNDSADGAPKYGVYVNLATCSRTRQKVEANKNQVGWYSSIDPRGGDEGPPLTTSYEAFSYFPAQHADRFAVSTMQNDGGTGVFTTILLLDRDGHQLKVVGTLASGDLCDAGITNASGNMVANDFHYSTNLTSAGLVQAASGRSNIKNLTLSSNPRECIGEAHYVFNYETGRIKLNGVSLLRRHDLADAAKASDTAQQARCFDRLFVRQYAKDGNLNQYQAKVFGQLFMRQCF